MLDKQKPQTEIQPTSLEGVYILKHFVFSDQRGSFVKIFNHDNFFREKINAEFRENYFTISKKCVIRGMHFQIPPFDHFKIITVILGKVMDVILDIRKNSPTFGKYSCFEISSQKGKSLYISPGFAHGFKVLSQKAVVSYLQSSVYSPKHDAGIRYDSFGFDWGIKNPIVSVRDQNFLKFPDFKTPFTYSKTL